ncbi:MAG: VCBS repeat-containing protein [Flavobacteriales bacterium]|nr:VCBS repeat-containing protein [Flavobacteriales bacterium]
MKRTLLLSLPLALTLPAAAQNSCWTALPVSEGIYTVEAVDGAPSPGNACPYGDGLHAEWYTFTSPVDTGVVISTSFGEEPTDTRIQVYTGVCGALVCMVGDDDSGNGYSSELDFTAVANVTYYFNFDDNWSADGFQFSITLFPPPPPPLNLIDFVETEVPGMTYSLGAVDMNSDGLDDILDPTETNVHIGLQQLDGTFQFVDIATSPADHVASWSLCVGDLDKNGANDMLYGAGDGVTLMFANEDGTAFTEVSYDEYIFCQRTNMVDLNNDGHLDAFSCHDVDANVGFINNGTGTLVYSQGGYGETCGNYGSVFTDYNNDGLMDLFVSKCGCDPEDLLMPNSNGGIFTDVAPDMGWNDQHQSWSSAWGDYDNDGDMDAMIGSSSSTVHKFMRNNGDGTFTNVTNEVGVNANEGQSIEWTTHDFNNDAWLDILGGDGMLMNNGDGTFTFDASVPYNGPIGDMDNDGYLDILDAGSIHYNQSTGNNWLRIWPVGSVSNQNGIGARVHVITNGVHQIRDIKSGDGFRYMSSLLAHFGLGAATTATVEVHWPSGIVDHIENVQPNATLVVNEGLFSSMPETRTTTLSLFPVPATDRITVSGDDVNQRMALIFSITGQLVQSDMVRASTLHIGELASGVYLLEVTTPSGVLKERFVKE